MADRTIRPLPLVLEDVDAAWLTAALRTYAPDAAVTAVEIVDVNHGTCTKVRLRLELNEAGKRAGIPEIMFLKGGFEPHSREMWAMHEREVRGYLEVLPALKLNSPACYFADFDPDRQQAVILMEDLAVRGVTFCHPLKPQTYDAVARRLTALAQFHARTWGSEELLPGGRWDWPADVVLLCGIYFREFFAPDKWRRFAIEAPRAAAGSVHFNDQVWIGATLDRLAAFAKDLPYSVLHGDTHLGNLYVDPDGEPGFFDSLPKRGPGMKEVAYHVAGALDPMDRPRWERPLVQHYLDELGRNGVSPPTLDEAMHQYGLFLALGYFVFLFNDSLFQTEAINTAYTARFSAAMIDHDTAGLLAAIR